VGVVHPEGEGPINNSSSGSLGPSFYHLGNNGKYALWLRDYLKSDCDVMVTSHYLYLSNEKFVSRSEEYSLLKPFEVLTEEEWIRGGLTPWIDSVDESDVS